MTRQELLRSRVPRSSHGQWTPDPARRSPVDVITSQNPDRLQSLVPIRHWRMAASPFTFYRGAAAVMAMDLAATPSTGITAQICGDAHLSNFGFFGAPDRSLVFDINDFDETLPGPWEWDVKRLAASFAIAARNNALGSAAERELAEEVTQAYRNAMRQATGLGYLDVWYARISEEDVMRAFEGEMSKRDRRRSQKAVRKFRTRDSRHVLGKLAERTQQGTYQIISEAPLIIPLRELQEGVDPQRWAAGLREAFTDYLDSVPDHIGVLLRRYEFVDFAMKVVGVGSVGTRCSIVLLRGRDDDDPLFLQIKQAGTSVLEEYLPASTYANHGERVVEGQRLMQAASDIFLGWADIDASGHHYYWRQLKDMKGSLEVEDMDLESMHRYAQLCGWTLARAHARSSDTQAVASYLGKGDNFDRAMGEFAVRYADQNDADFEAFRSAIDSGEIPAQA